MVRLYFLCFYLRLQVCQTAAMVSVTVKQVTGLKIDNTVAIGSMTKLNCAKTVPN